MHTTSLTLIERLRTPDDQEAWLRFVRLYTPLLYRWAQRAGSSRQDAEDLVQEVFELLVRKLPEFRYQAGGSFRNWLHVVTVNKWRERCRRAAAQGEGVRAVGGDRLDDVPAPDEAAAFEETEYRNYLVRRALQLIEPEFSSSAWNAFVQHVVEGRPADEVAERLGLRVGTVYAAKSRVMTRLRRELNGLVD